jgi:hypothetical protein
MLMIIMIMLAQPLQGEFFNSFLQYFIQHWFNAGIDPEAKSKEKQGVWDPMPELTITSPSVDSRVDSYRCTMDSPWT